MRLSLVLRLLRQSWWQFEGVRCKPRWGVALACIPFRSFGGSESVEECRSAATVPEPWGFKTNDGLISCHEQIHLFNVSVFGSVTQDLQSDIPDA